MEAPEGGRLSRAGRGRRAAAVLLAAALASCATRQPGDPIRPRFNVYSPQDDIALGRELSAEVRRQVQVVDNPRLQGYIRSIGQRLAEQPEAGDYPYEFTLINEPSINAFALPGGPIFVHSGLVAAAENEAQLAGVLGHEIAHVSLRHGTSQASRAQMIQLPAVLAGAAIGDRGILAQAGQIGLGLGLNALLMKYSRSAEKEADALGARILNGAGYDPLEMARFFEKLAAEGGSRPPIFLSSHPDPGNRSRLVAAEIAAMPPGERGYRAGDFAEARRLAANLPPPPKPRESQMAREGGPPPPAAAPGSFRQIRARDFVLACPADWETYGDSRSDTLTLAPQGGLVRTAQGSAQLGYGAVVSRYQPRWRTDALNATYELINELQEIDRGLRAVEAPRQVNLPGSAGLVTILRGRSPYGGAERVALLTVPRPTGLYYVAFVAPESEFDRAEPVFTRIVESLRFR